MARADFYLLRDAGDAAREHFACRLAAKVYGLDHQVHVRVADAAALERLDALLWTFSDDSFVPHEVSLDGQRAAPVTLADAMRPVTAGTEVCINLCDDTVTDDCPRIAEIVAADDTGRANGRQRYAQYRDRGLDLDMHEL